MRQLPLFSQAAARAERMTDRGPLDAESERLLSTFGALRLAQGAHFQSVRRELSQVRAVAREGGLTDGPASLAMVFADLDLIARVLREPKATIARSTGHTRLLAVQRFIQVMGPTLGRDPAADLATLDTLLPARRPTGWHSAGTVVAGTTGRRHRGPTLAAADLRRIVDAAAAGATNDRAHRDRAMVALQCFTGLRVEEIGRLRWEDLAGELSASGHYGLTAAVERRGRRLRLPLPAPAAEAVELLAVAEGGPIESLSGPLIRTGRGSVRALSYRAARAILRNACRRAGLPPIESVSLRAACAYWLRCQGLSDHEVAAVMGLAKVRTLDRLLRRHAALDAQRAVREVVVL